MPFSIAKYSIGFGLDKFPLLLPRDAEFVRSTIDHNTGCYVFWVLQDCDMSVQLVPRYIEIYTAGEHIDTNPRHLKCIGFSDVTFIFENTSVIRPFSG